ncbi:IPT/TIG domain-containing protein [Pontibacter sp. HSC-36F09]|uniref:IPT/TIG domain-containing protein n=1 Tax=Pontibacter sp. HSC-36F09 TaxID=2910966 RepID=UPI0020A229AA|nr:IPT/TIG domain-containing protein [Pontibacter sp. HSC-36F09]MCP2044139.1 hypothetical protein [Pontibacter sp. HSC-36F09]
MKTPVSGLTILFLGLIFLVRCQDAEIAPKEYPIVLMEEVSASESGAKFSANVKSLGNEKALSHGFVWGSHPNLSIDVDDFKNISTELVTGKFALEINSGLVKGQTYYVRPFIRTESMLVYGSELSFTSEGSKPPEVHDFHPKFGSTGTSVEITGINFGFSAKSNTVLFGRHVAKVDSATATKIYVKVPKVTEPEKVDITVITAGMPANSKDKFDLYFPWLKLNFTHDINPASTTFTIGDNAYILNPNSSTGLKFNSTNKTWQTLYLPHSTGRYPKAFTISNKGYVLLENGFYEYNPNSEVWIQKADFPDKIERDDYAFTFSFDQMGFIGSCYRNQKLWSYLPNSDTWIRKADFPEDFTKTTSPVWGNFSFAIENSGYLGISQTAFAFNTFWKYDALSDSWERKKPLPSDAYNSYACMVIDGAAYVGLGSNFEWGDGYVSNKIWKYDQLNDSWIQFQNCPTSMAVNTSFGINGKGYLLSGFTKYSSSLREIWEFNPIKN